MQNVSSPYILSLPPPSFHLASDRRHPPIFSLFTDYIIWYILFPSVALPRLLVSVLTVLIVSRRRRGCNRSFTAFALSPGGIFNRAFSRFYFTRLCHGDGASV